MMRTITTMLHATHDFRLFRIHAMLDHDDMRCHYLYSTLHSIPVLLTRMLNVHDLVTLNMFVEI